MTPSAMTPSARPPIDWLRVERWTAQILADDPTDIRAAFADAGPPSFAWDPAPPALASDKLRFLRTHWDSLRHDAGIPRFSAVDPLNMRPILGYVILLEAVDGGRDFRYRLFGSVIAAVSEVELTGKLASELVASTPVIEFGLASYRAAFRRQLPLYTVRTPVGAYRTAQWHRLAMPLADDTGTVTRLIAVSVPLSQEGQLVGS